LGGRLDSTNVLTPELAVITNISKDHQQFLGDTLPLIAGEKAGIIKEGIPVVIGETHEETAPVFREKAQSVNAPLHFADQRYWVELVRSDLQHSWYRVARNHQAYVPELKVNLGGPFQHLNIQTALMALEIWQQYQDNRFLPYTAVEEGWVQLRDLTRFQGRWQVLGEKPLVLVDSAHNEGGLAFVMEALQQLAPTEGQGAARQGGRTRDRSVADSPAAPDRVAGPPSTADLHIVLGVVNDKDLATILPQFPTTARYYFAKADIPRGLPAAELQATAANFSLKGRTYTSVRNALRAAKRAASPEDVIFVGGSIFTVAEVL
jgi:dihydrofolate synthase/folylpolyglutamate synthase